MGVTSGHADAEDLTSAIVATHWPDIRSIIPFCILFLALFLTLSNPNIYAQAYMFTRAHACITFCCPDHELHLLKWRLTGPGPEAHLPLTLSCWPSPSGVDCFVNMEYESSAKFDLHNVHITIPVPQAPKINQVKVG